MSDEIVRVEREGEVGLICLAKPPVNALGVALRTAVYEALQGLLSDAGIKAVVLYGEGRFFSAGADIKDFGRANEKPTLPELLKAMNDSPKPVIAALHGVAFGGALELALAAHLRVGIEGLRVGLPEVKLGLLPGAGGTQRLTRLTGIASAVNIITSGRNVSGAEARDLGIIARLEEGSPREAGLRAARDVLDGSLSSHRTDSLEVALPTPRRSTPRGLHSRRSVRASMPRCVPSMPSRQPRSPSTQGLAKERALFMDLMQGEERAALVHAFFAERATAKIPEKDAAKRTIERIGIVGGGTMGVGIATAFLIAGFSVHLIEAQEDRVAGACAAIEKNLAGALQTGQAFRGRPRGGARSTYMQRRSRWTGRVRFGDRGHL